MLVQSVGGLVQPGSLTTTNKSSGQNSVDGSQAGDSSQPFLVLLLVVIAGLAALCAVNIVKRRRVAIALRTKNRYGSRPLM